MPARSVQRHLKLSLSTAHVGAVDAIAFRAFDTALGDRLCQPRGARFHFAGRLELNHWGGTVERTAAWTTLRPLDLMPAVSEPIFQDSGQKSFAAEDSAILPMNLAGAPKNPLP